MLTTIYDLPIYQAIYALMDSAPFVYVNAILCIVLFALYALSRESRDEHGRAYLICVLREPPGARIADHPTLAGYIATK